MALGHGVGFFLLFVMEVSLSAVWIGRFKMHKCRFRSTHYVARCFLCFLPFLTSLDNLRIFIGSFITESFAVSPGWRAYYDFVSFVHFVLFAFLIAECTVFAVIPRARQVDVAKLTDFEARRHTVFPNQYKYNRVIWIASGLITTVFVCIGFYAFIVFLPHNDLVHEHSIFRWKPDHDYFVHTHPDVWAVLGFHLPAVVSLFTIVMNVIIWRRYGYYTSLLITMGGTVCMGALSFGWPLGAFYIGNLFEFTLLLGYYLLDVYMYDVGVSHADNMFMQLPQ